MLQAGAAPDGLVIKEGRRLLNGTREDDIGRLSERESSSNCIAIIPVTSEDIFF